MLHIGGCDNARPLAQTKQLAVVGDHQLALCGYVRWLPPAVYLLTIQGVLSGIQVKSGSGNQDDRQTGQFTSMSLLRLRRVDCIHRGRSDATVLGRPSAIAKK